MLAILNYFRNTKQTELNKGLNFFRILNINNLFINQESIKPSFNPTSPPYYLDSSSTNNQLFKNLLSNAVGETKNNAYQQKKIKEENDIPVENKTFFSKKTLEKKENKSKEINETLPPNQKKDNSIEKEVQTIKDLIKEIEQKNNLSSEEKKHLKELKLLLDQIIDQKFLSNMIQLENKKLELVLQELLKDLKKKLDSKIEVSYFQQNKSLNFKNSLNQIISIFKNSLNSIFSKVKINNSPNDNLNKLKDLKEIWTDFKSFEEKNHNVKTIKVDSNLLIKNEVNAFTVIQGNLKSKKTLKSNFYHNNSKGFNQKSSTIINLTPNTLTHNPKATFNKVNHTFSPISFNNNQFSFSEKNNFNSLIKSELNQFLQYRNYSLFNDKINNSLKLNFSLLQNHLVKSIKNGIVQNQEIMTVKLKPEFLGNMKIIIKKENDFIHLKLLVENQQIKEIINEKLVDLKQSLAKENVDLLSLEVNVNQNNHGENKFSELITNEENDYQSNHNTVNQNEVTSNQIIDLRSNQKLNLII